MNFHNFESNVFKSEERGSNNEDPRFDSHSHISKVISIDAQNLLFVNSGFINK